MALTFACAELHADEFRTRQAEARRNGTPAWLWPEVSMSAWVDACQQISEAASSVLSGGAASLTESDLMALSLAAYTSGMGPLLGWWCEQGQLSAPLETRDLLSIHLTHGRARANQATMQSREIVSALDEAGVPIVILKGAHTAHSYFPDPATRPMSDLDLLVPRDASAQAEVVLARAGFECAERSPAESNWIRRGAMRQPRSLWLAHADDPWSVDLHTSLNFSAGAGASVVRFDSADPIGTSSPWLLNDAAGVLSQPLLLLHLAVHASGGLHSLTLLRMVELVLIARHDVEKGRLSWDELLHLGAHTKALGAAYPALRNAEKLAAGAVPAHVLQISAELAPPRTRAIVDKLDPASAQRVGRASISEHFMWVSGFSGWLRQLASDLLPRAGADRSIRSIYEARVQALLRGRVTR